MVLFHTADVSRDRGDGEAILWLEVLEVAVWLSTTGVRHDNTTERAKLDFSWTFRHSTLG